MPRAQKDAQKARPHRVWWPTPLGAAPCAEFTYNSSDAPTLPPPAPIPTPKAKRGGLRNTDATDLLATVFKATLDRTQLDPKVRVAPPSCCRVVGLGRPARSGELLARSARLRVLLHPARPPRRPGPPWQTPLADPPGRREQAKAQNAEVPPPRLPHTPPGHRRHCGGQRAGPQLAARERGAHRVLLCRHPRGGARAHREQASGWWAVGGGVEGEGKEGEGREGGRREEGGGRKEGGGRAGVAGTHAHAGAFWQAAAVCPSGCTPAAQLTPRPSKALYQPTRPPLPVLPTGSAPPACRPSRTWRPPSAPASTPWAWRRAWRR